MVLLPFIALDSARLCATFVLSPTFEDREMQFNTENGPLDVAIDQLIVAGWTGSDATAVQHHIDELAAIGVAPPSKVPLFYRVSNTLLTTETTIDVLGDSSSGEAEPLLIMWDGDLWLGLSSDHTDRQLETTSVAASKQICAKPCAATLWKFTEVEDRLEKIVFQSWIKESDDWVLYQEGSLEQIKPLRELIDAAQMSNGSAMLCGTFAAIGGVRPSNSFRARMVDHEATKDITLEYTARHLPVVF